MIVTFWHVLLHVLVTNHFRLCIRLQTGSLFLRLRPGGELLTHVNKKTRCSLFGSSDTVQTYNGI